MKKKLLVIGAVVLVLALGFASYKFVYPKFVEKVDEKKEKVVKEEVIEKSNPHTDEDFMPLFVEWMNNEDRTKAKLVEHKDSTYAVVTYYNEDGSITEKAYDVEDVMKWRKEKLKELGLN